MHEYDIGSVAYRYNQFNAPYDSSFVYGYFNCRGSETNLLDCYTSLYYLRRCYYYYIAGVSCHGKSIKTKWCLMLFLLLDINECQQGRCSQVCTNTIGSYKCSCYSGYQLSDDSHTCIGK